jgi:hypothetical protein
MEAIQANQNNIEWVASLRHPLHTHWRRDMLLIDGTGIGTSDPAMGLWHNALHMLLAAWPSEQRAEGVDDEE